MKKKYYKLDEKYLLKTLSRSDEVSCINQLYDCVRAIMYLLNVSDYRIDEDMYKKIFEKDKSFFTICT